MQIMKDRIARAGRLLGSAVFLISSIPLLAQAAPQAGKSAGFQFEEATIAQVHAAMTAKQLTCRDLVAQYLKRIEANDKQGPALNAIIQVNPNALKEAEELDRRFARGGLTGPLHCVPAIVKEHIGGISCVILSPLRLRCAWFPQVPIRYKVLCGASHPNLDQAQIRMRRHKEPLELNR
jgi:hypothetical protein